MQTYRFSELTEEILRTLVTLDEEDSAAETWEEMQTVPLTPKESALLDYLKTDTHQRHLPLMNEATVWTRAIYPMLRLAEQGQGIAWAGVPLKATYPTFQLEGEADGALAPSVGGRMQPPYLIIMHEAKRGVNAPNPQFQLYGEILAAAWLNWERDSKTEQEISGCYTIADNWTFVQGVVGGIASEKPTFSVKLSKRYNGIFEAERIVQILKAIVAKHLEPKTNGGAEPCKPIASPN